MFAGKNHSAKAQKERRQLIRSAWLRNLLGQVESLSEEKMLEAEVRALREATCRRKGGHSLTVGLGLSGGGIRSAAFNLGVLQSLKRSALLDAVDYMSTVSGGGYIGSSLTWFLWHMKIVPGYFENRKFPFGTKRTDNTKEPGELVQWLRMHGAYLIQGDGLSAWSLVAVVLRGMLTNLLVLTPIFLGLMFLANMNFANWLGLDRESDMIVFLEYVFSDGSLNLFAVARIAGFLCFMVLFAAYISMAALSGFIESVPYDRRRKYDSHLGRLLKCGCLLVFFGSVPIASQAIGRNQDFFEDLYLTWIVNPWFLNGSGAALLSIGWRSRGKLLEKRALSRTLLNAGAILLSYGLLLATYRFVDRDLKLSWPDSVYSPVWLLLLPFVILAIANINRLSLHRYYRDRLMDAFMPDPAKFWSDRAPEAPRTFLKPDTFRLCAVTPSQRPYHILNTFLVTPDSRDDVLRTRGGTNFILSPLYCGSRETEYAKTSEYLNGGMGLATAMAVSGAALNPNTGVTRSKPLAFLMSVLNVRLGYWTRSPISPVGRQIISFFNLFRELLGIEMTEEHRYIHLADGGNFENLGMYELIKRRCDLIIVSDVGVDKDFEFGDLSRACELVRVDFGVSVDIDTEPLRPHKRTKLSKTPVVYGTIKYPSKGDSDPKLGRLVFIKSTIFKELPEDVLGYRRVNERFPDQSTTDQFFDERQFEAYRELGYRAAEKIEIKKSEPDGELTEYLERQFRYPQPD